MVSFVHPLYNSMKRGELIAAQVSRTHRMKFSMELVAQHGMGWRMILANTVYICKYVLCMHTHIHMYILITIHHLHLVDCNIFMQFTIVDVFALLSWLSSASPKSE